MNAFRAPESDSAIARQTRLSRLRRFLQPVAQANAFPALELVVGVTCHRNIPERQIEPIRQRVRDFFLGLRDDFPALPLTVLSALAEGGDQLAAQVALDVGARLVVPLPMPRQMYAGDFSGPAGRDGFIALCEQAQTIDLPLLPGSSMASIASSGLDRDLQYAQAGVFIARHCHILLAIWDGRPSDLLGGTAQVVAYHCNGNMPGLIERRRSERRMLHGGDERLVYQIVCSRDQPEGEPMPPLRPLQALWRCDLRPPASGRCLAGQDMPEQFHDMFGHMAEMNADLLRHAVSIDADLPAGGDGVAGEGPTHRLFRMADWLAIHFQKRVLLAMRTVYTLMALMGVAFMLYTDFSEDYMIFLFLFLFVAGLATVFLAEWRDWHRKYLDYRTLAEGLRVQSYWQRANISTTSDPEFAHDNFLQKQDVELGWIRNVMRLAALENALLPNKPDTGALEAVIAEWVGEPGKSGQLAYYEYKAVQRTRLHRITEWIGRLSLWTVVGISTFLALFVFELSQDSKTLLVAVMAIVSIVAAVREAYAFRKADKELIKQYRFMHHIFASARAALDACSNAEERKDVLKALGEAALAEHAEWTLMHRERPLERGRMS